jgi:hypothetical protein
VLLPQLDTGVERTEFPARQGYNEPVAVFVGGVCGLLVRSLAQCGLLLAGHSTHV